MMKGNEIIALYSTEDPAGMIPVSELSKLTDVEDVQGGTWTVVTTSSWACGATVAITIALCPTSKCTSAC